MEPNKRLTSPPWPYSEGPTPRFTEQKLLAEINKTETDVENRVTELKRVVRGTGFYLSTAALAQKERLNEYKKQLLIYKEKLQLRADWLRQTMDTLEAEVYMKMNQGDAQSPLSHSADYEE